MDFGIGGRVAVLTGGDSGMEYATAEMLLMEGVRVILTDLPGTPLDEAEAALKRHGEIVTVAAGLMKAEQVEASKQAAESRLVVPDVLVHAAGITGPTRPLHALTDEDWLKAL